MKTLIASGCSFTFEEWNWPTYTAQPLGLTLVNVAMASQGNDLIKKSIIAQVEKELETKKPEDLIVGIMWSGPDRWSYRANGTADRVVWGQNSSPHIKNPRSILDGVEPNWYIMNAHWTNIEAKLYYKYFHSEVGSIIETLEDILFTQLYLKAKGIPYFMTTYLDIFNKYGYSIAEHPEISYIYRNIDFTKFLSVTGCYEYLIKHCPEGMPHDGGNHPFPEGHKYFAENVILPYIKEYIYKGKLV